MTDQPRTERSSALQGPTVTGAALDNAISALREAFRERLAKDADRLVSIASSHTEELLRQAYLEGVRDGFVSGAEAQARLVFDDLMPEGDEDA